MLWIKLFPKRRVYIDLLVTISYYDYEEYVVFHFLEHNLNFLFKKVHEQLSYHFEFQVQYRFKK